jgi:hypothetical protein
MKYIIDTNTGKFLYSTSISIELAPNETEIEQAPPSNLLVPYYNFQTNTYFEGPSSEIPKIVPEEVQLWRLRAVIKITGKEAQVETAINNLSEPLKTGVRYAWEYGTIVERFSQTVILLQSILQLSESEVDDMFIQANNISI